MTLHYLALDPSVSSSKTVTLFTRLTAVEEHVTEKLLYACTPDQQRIAYLKVTELDRQTDNLYLSHLTLTGKQTVMLIFKVARNSFHFPQTSFTNSFVNTVWFIVSV